MPAHTDVPQASGRGWGYAGAALGGLVSIAANVAHSYVPPSAVAIDWHPPLGAVVGAVFWPVALFFAIEIMVRTAWPTGARWVVVRLLGLLPVALVAAIVSYNHLSGLLAHYGESWLTSHIGPLAVDGLMAMASAALMATAPHRLVDSLSAVGFSPADTVPDMSSDTALTEMDSATDTPRTPRRTSARKTGRTDTAAKVAALADKHPDMTTTDIAKRLKVSDRTVRRHLAAMTPPDSGAQALAAA